MVYSLIHYGEMPSHRLETVKIKLVEYDEAVYCVTHEYCVKVWTIRINRRPWTVRSHAVPPETTMGGEKITI